MNRNQAIALFVVYCIWIVAAAVIWGVALYMFLHPQNGDSSSYFMSGAICLIPMAFPILRFVIRVVRGAGNVGAQYWDVSISESGRVYASNHRFLYSLIALIIVVALVVTAGLFILPFYWLYFSFQTAIFGKRLFSNR